MIDGLASSALISHFVEDVRKSSPEPKAEEGSRSLECASISDEHSEMDMKFSTKMIRGDQDKMTVWGGGLEEHGSTEVARVVWMHMSRSSRASRDARAVIVDSLCEGVTRYC